MNKLDLTYMKNGRDLGGIKTTDGHIVKMAHLYRCGHLHRLSKEDIELINKLHLSTIIDFRNEVEFINKADYKFDGVEYINLSSLEEDQRLKKRYENADSNLLILLDKEYGGKSHMLNTYKSLATSKISIEAYKSFFKILCEDEKRVLFHCSQGKDRAGVAAWLLLYALGVDENSCTCDYLLTNEAMVLKVKELTPYALKVTNGDQSSLITLKEVFSADLDYINTYLDEIKTHYQSVEYYLKHILEVDIKRLRSLYLQ